jgi:hypothetical protein
MRKVFELGMDDYTRNRPVERIRNRAAMFSWENAAGEYLQIYRTI